MFIVAVGSVALNFHNRNVLVGKDIDLIMTYETYVKWLKNIMSIEEVRSVYPISNGNKMVVKTDLHIYEIEIAWEDSTADEFLALVCRDKNTTYTKQPFGYAYPSVEALLMMKLSHRYLKNSPHFLKTMRHIHLMRGMLYYSDDVTGMYQEWFKRREEETYNYVHPNLDTVKNEFFKDEPFYMYDHDDIHESVKIGHTPAYKRILADGAQVKCDKVKFDNLTYEHKLHCALEECYTLALERMLIPNDMKADPRKAFEIALMKVCTSITSGWFREWCWENYDEILNNYNGTYIGKFEMHLVSGLIRPFTHDRKM